MKIAPTLSAEERYKLLVPDFHREVMGEKPLISESERKAIIKFDNRAVWEEYTHSICMFQWAHTLWPKDIEAERLRLLACSLFLSHAFERVLLDGDQPVLKETRAGQFEKLKEYVALFERQSVEFYCYQEAINTIELELYGVPLFNEEKKDQIASCYETTDQFIEHYNETIRWMCENEVTKRYFKPIVHDMNSFLVKKPVPDANLVEHMVNDIRQIAESETRMLGR